MNLRTLFSRKPSRDGAVERSDRTDTGPVSELTMDSLDACVGGREEANGVGCYMRSTPTQAH